jgi:hypothetical protein
VGTIIISNSQLIKSPWSILTVNFESPFNAQNVDCKLFTFSSILITYFYNISMLLDVTHVVKKLRILQKALKSTLNIFTLNIDFQIRLKHTKIENRLVLCRADFYQGHQTIVRRRV